MADVAELGVRVTSEGIEKVERDFSNMAASGERAADRIGKSGSTASSKFSAGLAQHIDRSRAAADQHAKAFQAQFQADQARIAEGLARGFITPAQARAAGIDAAKDFNAGVLSQLDKLGAAGLNTTNSQAYRDLAGSLKGVSEQAAKGVPNLNSVRAAVTSMASSALHAAPGVTQLSSVLGSLALGSGVMIGVMAGIAALSFAWDKLTESSRKLKEENQRLLKTLDDIAKRRGETAASTTQGAVAAGRRELEELQRGQSTGTSWLSAAEAAKRIQDLKSKIAAGEAELTDIVTKGAADRARAFTSDLAGIVSGGQATAAQIRDAKLLVKGYEDTLTALRRTKPGDLAGQADLVRTINELKSALTGAVGPTNDLKDAQARLKEIAQLNAQVAADEAAAVEKITASFAKFGVQVTENTKLVQDYADALKFLNSLKSEVAAIGARNEAATKRETDATIEAAKAAKKYADDMRNIWAQGISKIITDGTKSFRDFFEDVLQMFLKLRDRMEREGKGDTLGAKLLGYGAAAIGGGFAGYQVGQRLGSTSAGALAGAGVGAATGFATAGVPGAILGGLAGAVGGMLGAADAHKEAARALKEAAKSLETNITAFGTSNPVAQALISNQVQADTLIKNANLVYGIIEKGIKLIGGTTDDTFGKRKAEIERIASENAFRIAQDFWGGITEQMNALKGPAGAYANQLLAIQKAFDQNVESAKALGYGLAQVTELYEAQKAAATAAYEEGQKRVLDDLALRKLAATGGSDRAVDDRRFDLAQERELYDLRLNGTDEAIAALIELLALEAKQRDEDFAALNRRAQEDYRVRQLQANGHTAEADALRLALDQQREYQDAVKAGLDDATLAALKLAQAAESAAAAAQKAATAQRALEDLQVRALAAQGQDAAADQLRFQLQQQREIEEAQRSGQSQEYIQKLVDVLRLEAEARQRGLTAPQVAAPVTPYTGGETEAISNVARGITEVTGNRMADYLASMLITLKQIRDTLAGKALAAPLTGIAPTTANLQALVTQIPSALPTYQQQTAPTTQPTSTSQSSSGAPVFNISITVEGNLSTDRSQIKAQAKLLVDDMQAEIALRLAESRLALGDPTVQGV